MRHVTVLVVLLFACGSSSLIAQSFDYSPFLTFNDPTLQVTYTPMSGPCTPAATCTPAPPLIFPSLASVVGTNTPGRDIGTDSAGNDYAVATRPFFGPICNVSTDTTGPLFLNLYRRNADGTSGKIATINLVACLDATCSTFDIFGGAGQILNEVDGPWIDPVAGTLSMVLGGAGDSCVCYGTLGPLCQTSVGLTKVTISGIPKLFDTLLTFLPSGQTITALTPGLPDGFRSADSLQVWTGNVKTLPDWSQATVMACTAATAPAPGQAVKVNDALPDPDPGTARYYVVASLSGTQRRLGRQFVSGAFSARNPTSLPVCQ